VSKLPKSRSVEARGTLSRSFGHNICHPYFHNTSTDVISYDVSPPRHLDHQSTGTHAINLRVSTEK
jgi:hypothetical protein